MAEPSETGLIAANLSFYRAFESLDLDRMASLWARAVPVSCVHPGWDLVLGVREVVESWREIFAGTTSIRFELEAAQATLVGDAGWVVCREILHTSVQGQPVENVMTATNTFCWQENAWLITHHHAAPRMSGRPQPKTGQPQTLH